MSLTNREFFFLSPPPSVARMSSWSPPSSKAIMKWLWIALLLHALQVTESQGLFSFVRKPTPSPEKYQCRCNFSEVYEELPYFLQELGRDERFDWAFQGKRGERGADGPEGPAGFPGLHGRDGAKGERGESGPRGLPGTSLVFNPKGSFFGSGGSGERGNVGPKGNRGRKGTKGEPGTTFTTVLKDGSYIEVKGQKGGRGGRGLQGIQGERGEAGSAGAQGLSIQGQKGMKGEPAVLPDVDLLRGPPGPRGNDGLPGPPGIGCRPGRRERDADVGAGDCGNPPIFFQRKGDRGEQGMPGVSLMGEKGNVGPPGPPGSLPEDFTATLIFKSEHEMRSQKRPPGTISLILREDKAFIRVSNGWREITLGTFLQDQEHQYVEENRVPLEDDRANAYYRYEDEQNASAAQRKKYYLERPTPKNRYRRRHFPGARRDHDSDLTGAG